MSVTYRGRLAPSPTGLLHLGHARTFGIAASRAKDAAGLLFLRNDDLDRARCRPEFVDAMMQDLAWLGFEWESPRVNQSERLAAYRDVLSRLHAGRWIFPCNRSRRDVQEAVGAPHEAGGADEPVYPPTFRPSPDAPLPDLTDPIAVNWRFRVPDGEEVVFEDGRLGIQRATAGRDFGDFLVWRRDDLPSYQLACTVDDHDMHITEVVRGADLIQSTFRQILLYRALGWAIPRFYHCELMKDQSGERLAKRNDALSLRALREQGVTPQEIIRTFGEILP